MKQDLESPRRLAARTGWPESRIRSLIASNKIRYLRIGKNILIPSDAIEEYVSVNTIVPEGLAK